MAEIMEVCCDGDGVPRTKLHGLRMLDPQIFGNLPLSSADSTNIGRNVGIDAHWNGSYQPVGKPARARVMRQRIEAYNAPARWGFMVPEMAEAIQGELL